MRTPTRSAAAAALLLLLVAFCLVASPVSASTTPAPAATEEIQKAAIPLARAPEPGTLVSLGSGIALLMSLRRRRFR